MSMLSHNTLSGQIPKSMRVLLVHLNHRSNRLFGRVPLVPDTLVYLSLDGNRLSGQVG